MAEQKPSRKMRFHVAERLAFSALLPPGKKHPIPPRIACSLRPWRQNFSESQKARSRNGDRSAADRRLSSWKAGLSAIAFAIWKATSLDVSWSRLLTEMRSGMFCAMKTTKEPPAVTLGRRGGLARAKKLSKKEQSAIGRKAAQARWRKASKP